MVSSVFSTVKRYGDYGANFLLGTGSDRIGKEIGLAIKAGKRANLSLTDSIGIGFKKGVVRNSKDLEKSGGFIKNLIKTFKETPKAVADGWKGAQGFSKFTKAVKPLGKLLPFAMNALWLASSIPDIINRTKDEGIFGGIKEAAKTVAKMAVFSVSAAAGGVFGFAGLIGVPLLTGIAADKILGESYSIKKENEHKKNNPELNNPELNNPFAQNQVGQKLDIVSRA